MPKAFKFNAWSYSRYSDYKLCPLKAKLAHLDKIREPKNAAMERGATMHTQIEHYIKGLLRAIPKELKDLKPELERLKKKFKSKLSNMTVEDNWAFRKNWTATQWNDWAECWVRVKLDIAFHDKDPTIITVRDWKSGKYRPEEIEAYIEQLELQALATLIKYPHAEEVWPQLFYVDAKVIHDKDMNGRRMCFTSKDLPRLQKIWEKRVRPMMNDTVFPPRPNNKCHWCWFSQGKKAEGGPGLCRY